MTEQEMQEKIDDLTYQVKKLKEENKRLKKENAELMHCNEVYQRFISGGNQDA